LGSLESSKTKKGKLSVALDFEHLGAADFTDGFGCHFTVLHLHILVVFTFSFSTTLYTIHHIHFTSLPEQFQLQRLFD